MTDRVSLIEQYDNRDVIAQIYRIINIAEHGAIETLVATKEGSSVKLIFTMHDGTKHEITFESNGVKDVYAVQSGSTETVHVVLDDDTERTFAFDIAIAGVTTDTQQTITARKTFTAPQTFSGGIEGTTMIDGDVQVSNGHSLSVAGDIDTAGDMQVAGNAEFLGNVEAGGMAIEESNGRTVLSNSNGISVEGQVSLDAMTVAGMTISKSEDRATILDNDDPIIVPHTLEVATNLTGTRDSQAVNGIRLQNDLDNYAQMLRTTGNQTKSGLLELYQAPKCVEYVYRVGYTGTDLSQWFKIGKLVSTSAGFIVIMEVYSTGGVGHTVLRISQSQLVQLNPIFGTDADKFNFKLTTDPNGVKEVWAKANRYYSYICCIPRSCVNFGNNATFHTGFEMDTSQTTYPEPTIENYPTIVDDTVIA